MEDEDGLHDGVSLLASLRADRRAARISEEDTNRVQIDSDHTQQRMQHTQNTGKNKLKESCPSSSPHRAFIGSRIPSPSCVAVGNSVHPTQIPHPPPPPHYQNTSAPAATNGSDILTRARLRAYSVGVSGIPTLAGVSVPSAPSPMVASASSSTSTSAAASLAMSATPYANPRHSLSSTAHTPAVDSHGFSSLVRGLKAKKQARLNQRIQQPTAMTGQTANRPQHILTPASIHTSNVLHHLNGVVGRFDPSAPSSSSSPSPSSFVCHPIGSSPAAPLHAPQRSVSPTTKMRCATQADLALTGHATSTAFAGSAHARRSAATNRFAHHATPYAASGGGQSPTHQIDGRSDLLSHTYHGGLTQSSPSLSAAASLSPSPSPSPSPAPCSLSLSLSPSPSVGSSASSLLLRSSHVASLRVSDHRSRLRKESTRLEEVAREARREKEAAIQREKESGYKRRAEIYAINHIKRTYHEEMFQQFMTQLQLKRNATQADNSNLTQKRNGFDSDIAGI